MDTLMAAFRGPQAAPKAPPATPLPAPSQEPAQDAPEALAESIAEPFEGFSTTPYRCPAGVWTIGFGSTRDADGNPVTASTPPVTKDQARKLMERDMHAALVAVRTSVHTPLTRFEEGALADFVYNVGVGNFRASTLLRKLNAGDHAGALAELPKWNLAGGKVLAGLVRRRAAEKAMAERTS